MTMILNTVKNTIAKHGLLEKKDSVLLAFSGGLDSTGLLGIFLDLRNEWALDLFLGHFNHKLRTGADEDQRFVENTAQKYGLPLYVASEDVREFAKQNRLNLEEAGRLLRYDFLLQAAQRIGGAKIATGHTLNDQAETFFLRLIRGSGPRGLGSISPLVEGRIIRPLLALERKDIAEFVRKNRMEYREDESNFDRRYARNKVRLDLIPYIQENFDPDIIRRIGKIVSILREEDLYLENLASLQAERTIYRGKEEIGLDLETLSSLPRGLARRVVRHFIQELKGDLRGITFDNVESLMNLEEGKTLPLTKGLLLKREKGKALRMPGLPERIMFAYEWHGSSPLIIGEIGGKIESERIKRPPAFVFDDNTRAYLDGEKVKFPLRVRNRREGDRYHPLGAPGHKKLKEVMRAKGIPLAYRDRKPVFLSGGEIVWVCGLPVAERFKVSEGTKEVLVLTCTFLDRE